MHYADGTEAKIGDVAACVSGGENPKETPRKYVGVVTKLTAGGTSCNGQMAVWGQVIDLIGGGRVVVPPEGNYPVTFTVGDAVKLL